MTIYFAGGEDSEFTAFGPAAVSTTASSFRSSFARCCLGLNASVTPGWWQSNVAIPTIPNPCWLGMQHDLDLTTNAAGSSSVQPHWGFIDNTGVYRLWFGATGGGASGGAYPLKCMKTNLAGTSTQLGSNFNIPYTTSTHQTFKLDTFVNYGASGAVQVYVNGVQVFSFSGDTTTDSLTNMNGMFIRLGSSCNQNLNGPIGWSECILADADTRSLSLQTLAPVANGNTHSFDTGSPAASNVNETTLNDSTLDGSSVAGQIDEYTIPSIASGSYGIIAVGVSARMAKGSSGPSKMDLALRSGTTDYLSSDQVLSLAWQNYQNWWMTDPNTSAAWTALPVNIGLKSVT